MEDYKDKGKDLKKGNEQEKAKKEKQKKGKKGNKEEKKDKEKDKTNQGNEKKDKKEKSMEEAEDAVTSSLLVDYGHPGNFLPIFWNHDPELSTGSKNLTIITGFTDLKSKMFKVSLTLFPQKNDLFALALSLGLV